MLREFIKCSGLEDRIRLIDESVPSDWDESELATVCQIAGIADKVKGMDAEETLEVLRSALSDKLDESMEEDEAALPFGRILEEEDAVGTTGTEEAYEKMDGLIAAINLNQSFPQ